MRPAAPERCLRLLQPPADEVLEQLREPRIDALEADADAQASRIGPGDAPLEFDRDRDPRERELTGDRSADRGQFAGEREADATGRQVATGTELAASLTGEFDPPSERGTRCSLGLRCAHEAPRNPE